MEKRLWKKGLVLGIIVLFVGASFVSTTIGFDKQEKEIKHVDLPEEMRRAMARQAEAEREKRAKIIHANGEKEASVALAQAADTLSASPASLQLRYLQTLVEVASEQNSTILPIPIDIIREFAAALKS